VVLAFFLYCLHYLSERTQRKHKRMNDISSYREPFQVPTMITWTTILIVVAVVVLITNPVYMAHAINIIVPIADVLCRIAMHFLLTVKFILPTIALS